MTNVVENGYCDPDLIDPSNTTAVLRCLMLAARAREYTQGDQCGLLDAQDTLARAVAKAQEALDILEGEKVRAGYRKLFKELLEIAMWDCDACCRRHNFSYDPTGYCSDCNVIDHAMVADTHRAIAELGGDNNEQTNS